MPDPPKKTLGEWGRRLYVDKGINYFRQMRRRAPHKAFLDKESEKHSEFKKPYKSDNYDSMEYNRGPRKSTFRGYPDWQTNPLSGLVVIRGAIVKYCDIGFYGVTHCNDWFRVEVTFPKIVYIIGKYGPGQWEVTGAVSKWVQGKRWDIIHILPDYSKRETHGPYADYAVINVRYIRPDGPKGDCIEEKKILCCPGDPNIYMDDDNPDTMEVGESVNISGGGGLPPYEWAIIEGTGFTLDDTVDPVLISAGGSAEDFVTIRVTDSCGEYADQTVSICPSVEVLEYDDDSSAETVDQSDTAQVYVLGGSPPFTWNISGTGFSLSATVTNDRENTVITSGSACGVGTITITDACDEEVEGIIRCTEGSWVNYEDNNPGYSNNAFLETGNICTDDGATCYDGSDIGYGVNVVDRIIVDELRWHILGYKLTAYDCYKASVSSWDDYTDCGGDICPPDPPGVDPSDYLLGPENCAGGSPSCNCYAMGYALWTWECS